MVVYRTGEGVGLNRQVFRPWKRKSIRRDESSGPYGFLLKRQALCFMKGRGEGNAWNDGRPYINDTFLFPLTFESD